MQSDIMIPVSTGELFDKITILEIKLERLSDPPKLLNVQHEIGLLRAIVTRSGLAADRELAGLVRQLKAVNTQIWEAEDRIRDFERGGLFETEFLTVARSIYHLNDERAATKRRINVLTSSSIVEEKSYSPYQNTGAL